MLSHLVFREIPILNIEWAVALQWAHLVFREIPILNIEWAVALQWGSVASLNLLHE